MRRLCQLLVKISDIIQSILSNVQVGAQSFYYRARAYQSQIALLKGDYVVAVVQAHQTVQNLTGQKLYSVY